MQAWDVSGEGQIYTEQYVNKGTCHAIYLKFFTPCGSKFVQRNSKSKNMRELC